MKFELTILGNNAASPTAGRNPSAQVLNNNESLYLIDCGEGTQMQFRKYQVKYNRIDHIFISHLHGDHYLGLVPLLFTYHLLGRSKAIHVFANRSLEEIIHLQLKASDTTLRYPLIFQALPEKESVILIDNEEICVSAFPLRHRVPTHGFVFEQKISEKNIRIEKIAEYRIPVSALPSIKKGEDYTDALGNKILNDELTIEKAPAKKFTYCSDTGYNPEMISILKGSDLLYHEATFMHDLVKMADEKEHATGVQAALIAKEAEVLALLLGHFSSRYQDLQPLLDEAREVFPKTELSEEGKVYKI
jgi:ribonuclease Z